MNPRRLRSRNEHVPNVQNIFRCRTIDTPLGFASLSVGGIPSVKSQRLTAFVKFSIFVCVAPPYWVAEHDVVLRLLPNSPAWTVTRRRELSRAICPRRSEAAF